MQLTVHNTPGKTTATRSEFDFQPIKTNKLMKALDLNSMATTEKKLKDSETIFTQFDLDNVESLEHKHEDRY